MTRWKMNSSQDAHVATICQYAEDAEGLDAELTSSGEVAIKQHTDGKNLAFKVEDIEEVISRFDSEGQSFLQVNFNSGKKILLTHRLVGFKPATRNGLDMERLPRVVTTPDLVSVVEAIEESMSSDDAHPIELEVLRKVFDAVLEGGESVGFNLGTERAWLQRLIPVRGKASA